VLIFLCEGQNADQILCDSLECEYGKINIFRLALPVRHCVGNYHGGKWKHAVMKQI